jgi:hypothetical protein
MNNYPLPGDIWSHYKGGIYEVVCLSMHTETEETLITYKSVPFGTHYTRPFSMREESVMIGSISERPRFSLIKRLPQFLKS